jgi:two-component system nitrate/nitrite sensor histidine kinase NarX
MRRPWTLSTKLGAIGGTLLLVALVSIGLTLWVTWQLEGGAAAVNEAGRMRMQTWRLAQTLAAGDATRIEVLLEQFDQSVAVLRSGDPSRPLFVPRDQRSQESFAVVQHDWATLRSGWSAAARPAAAEVARQAEAFVERIDAFVSAIELQLAQLTAILNAFQFVLVALAIISAVTLLYSAYLFVFNQPKGRAWPRCTKPRPLSPAPPRWTRWRAVLRSRCGAWRRPTPRRCAGLMNPTSVTC